MNKGKLLNALYQYSLISILLLAIAIKGGNLLFLNDENDQVSCSLEDIQHDFPKTTKLNRAANGIYTAFSKKGEPLGDFILSHEFSRTSGYGGPVPMIIFLSDDQNRVRYIRLLENNESEEFLDHVLQQRLLNTWDGQKLALIGKIDCDAVTGATETSSAIINDMQNVAGQFGSLLHEQSTNNIINLLNIMLFLLVIMASIIMIFRPKYKRFRTVYLILVLLGMGVMLHKVLSTSFLHNILISGFHWKANSLQLLLLLLAILLPFLGKKQYFCNYLCPMGALQELVAKINPRKKYQPARIKLNGISLSEISLTLLWSAILLGFTPALEKLEPFMFFSFRVIGWGMALFGFVIIVLSIFMNRPWCALCPTGCLLKKLEPIKTKNKHENIDK